MTHYVYRLLDAASGVLYVGCTSNIHARTKSHRTSQPWGDQIRRMVVTLHDSEPEALTVEREEIALLRPRHNITQPSVLVNDAAWLAARRSEGLSNREIAELAGVSKCRVNQAIKAHGLIRYTRPALSTPVLLDREWLAGAISDGPTLDELAERSGASKTTVRSYLHSHDLHKAWKAAIAERVRRRQDSVTRTVRPPKYPLLRDAEQLAHRVAEIGCAAVAREVGCDISSVMRALEREGYAIPRLVRPARVASAVMSAVADDYLAGESAVAVAAKYGLTGSTVLRYVRLCGGAVRGRGRPVTTNEARPAA